jgi:hypothetical protein
MNERIKELAMQAGLVQYASDSKMDAAERFAELIRAEERQACIDICDIEADEWGTNSDGAYAARNCGERIRERN